MLSHLSASQGDSSNSDSQSQDPRSVDGGGAPPQLLLVLDNLEDALNADAAGVRLLLGTLLWSAPGVRVLVTSRRPVLGGDGVLSTIGGDVSHTRESVVSLGALPAAEAAELLVRRSPRRLTRVEVFGEGGSGGGSAASEGGEAAAPAVGSSRPDGKTAALGRLSGHPVLRYLNGHPHAITLAAALLLDRSLSEVAHFLKTRGAMSLTPAGMPHLLGGLSPNGTPLPAAAPEGGGSLTPSAMQSSLSLAGSLSASVTALATQHGETLPLLLLCGLLPRGLHDGDFVWLCTGLPFLEGLIKHKADGSSGASPYMPRGSPPMVAGKAGARSPANLGGVSGGGLLDPADGLSICSGSTALSASSLGSRASSVDSSASGMTAFSALMGGGRASPAGTGGGLFGLAEGGGAARPIRGGPPMLSKSASDGSTRPRALANGQAGAHVTGLQGGGMPWWAQDGLNPWGGAALAEKLRRRRSKLVARATNKKGPRGGVQGGWSGMRNLRFDGGEAGGIASVKPRANAAGRGVHVLTAVTESMFEGGGHAEGMHSPQRSLGASEHSPTSSAQNVDWRAAADVLVQWSILERRQAGGGGIPQPKGGASAGNAPRGPSPGDEDVPLALAVLHAWLSLVYLGDTCLGDDGDGASPTHDTAAGTGVPSGAVSVGSAQWERTSVASGHSLSALSFGGGSSLLTFDTVGDDDKGGQGGIQGSLPPMDAASIVAWALSPSSASPCGVVQGASSVASRLRAAARLSLRWYSTFPYVVEYARYTLAPPLTSMLPTEKRGSTPVDAVHRSSIVPPPTRMLRVALPKGGAKKKRGGIITPCKVSSPPKMASVPPIKCARPPHVRAPAPPRPVCRTPPHPPLRSNMQARFPPAERQ